jgi:5,6-dimethylbenzimidazole synthase
MALPYEPNSRFDEPFRATLTELISLRRDVRRFRRDALPEGLLDELLRLACLAPSVGFSQPWRWVTVDSPARRAAVLENFRTCNQQALADFEGDRAALYARLKLAGLQEAPVHLAVFVDPGTQTGSGLGRKTMPEMLCYSAVCAIHTLWLLARAQGIGVGWVSILDANDVMRVLDVPAGWRLIGYLCLGYPEVELDVPELEREGWERRGSFENTRFYR